MSQAWIVNGLRSALAGGVVSDTSNDRVTVSLSLGAGSSQPSAGSGPDGTTHT